MERGTLIQYGAFTLTQNPNISATLDQGMFSHGVEITTLPNARSAGSTVVDSEVKEKQIALNVIVKTDLSREMIDVFNDLNSALEENNRLLRFIPKWQKIASPLATTGWTIGNDGINLAFTATDRRLYGSLSFDVDVSANVANSVTLYNSSLTQVDLSSVALTGNFELFVKITNKDYVTGVTVRVGNDSSNYYSATITSQVDGTPFVDGWNLLSIAWSNMAQTGTVTTSTIDYVYLSYEYSVSQTDATGFMFGGLYWQDDTDTRNFTALPAGFSADVNRGNAQEKKGTLSFIAPAGVATSTNTDSAYTASNLVGLANYFDLNLRGSFTPSPVITMTMDVVTGLGNIVITNLSTNDSVTLDNNGIAWAIGDIIEFDTENNQVLRNGNSQNFQDVLPRFNIGRNRMLIAQSGASPTTISQLVQNSQVQVTATHAQSFTTVGASVLTNIALYLKKYAVSGSFYLEVYNDNAGVPGTTLLYAFSPVTISNVAFEFIDFPLNLSLSATTKYWLLMSANAYVGYNSVGGYAGGDFRKYAGGGSWDASIGDATFELTLSTALTAQFDLAITNKPKWK